MTYDNAQLLEAR